MTGFDFAVSTDSSNASTNDDDTEASPDFEANETADLYLSFGDWQNVLGAMLDALDLEALKVYSDDTLEDAPRLLGEHSEAHPQQHLHMVATLAKSTAGKLQLENDHAIGLSDGKAPASHDEVQQDFSYALFANGLPTITSEGLDGGEREALEQMGVDPSELGFDPAFGGPKLLRIDDERLPVAVEDGDEVTRSLELLNEIPNEPSAYTEDGFRPSSDPSVFDGSDDTDKGELTYQDVTDDDNPSSLKLAREPSKVNEVNVSDLRGQGAPELSVSNIDSLRTINTMIKHEQQGDTRKGAMQRLKERRNALQGDDSDDSDDEDADVEDVEEQNTDDNDEDDESNEAGLSDADKQLISALLNSGEAESFEEAKQMVV